jgi:hypothetical protein
VEVGKDALPTWLHFDVKNHQLKGIPSPGDIGQHYLEVVTFSKLAVILNQHPQQ